jgi:NAD(P)-dependent dehydrogenase (short-subunit alcohol dehydrogenase family)
VARDIPLGRIGKPEDIAAVASFLCRRRRVRLRQVIYVNGGTKIAGH